MTVELLLGSVACRKNGLGVSRGAIGDFLAKYVDARGGLLGGR